jgi:membrane protein YqaA with SNARE-associated domain
MKVFRRLYDWVLSWADGRFALPALGLLSFAEASFFPVPPDVLLMALALSKPKLSFRYAFIASCGSLLGGIVGYLLGWGLWDLLGPYFFAYIPGVDVAGFEHVRSLFARFDFWVIFAAGFTPIPYKIFTIAAGVFQINFPVFFLASLIGRSLRFYLVAAILYLCADRARQAIDKYFNLLSFMLLVIIALVVVLYRYFN